MAFFFMKNSKYFQYFHYNFAGYYLLTTFFIFLCFQEKRFCIITGPNLGGVYVHPDITQTIGYLLCQGNLCFLLSHLQARAHFCGPWHSTQ